VAVLHDLQDVTSLVARHGGETPVVEDEQIDARQTFEEPRVSAVAACERERIEEARQTLTEDGVIIPADLMAERAR